MDYANGKKRKLKMGVRVMLRMRTAQLRFYIK